MTYTPTLLDIAGTSVKSIEDCDQKIKTELGETLRAVEAIDLKEVQTITKFYLELADVIFQLAIKKSKEKNEYKDVKAVFDPSVIEFTGKESLLQKLADKGITLDWKLAEQATIVKYFFRLSRRTKDEAFELNLFNKYCEQNGISLLLTVVEP